MAKNRGLNFNRGQIFNRKVFMVAKIASVYDFVDINESIFELTLKFIPN